MIEAVIFDCFGVLVRGTFGAFRDKYFPEDNLKVRRMQELDDLASRGYMPYHDFIIELAELAGISEEQTIREIEGNPPNEPLFSYITDKLLGHYKIGLLSNAAENWLSELFTKQQLALFDDTVLSCEVGLAKPDVAIFELAANRLNVLPENCVFVDDSLRYCTGAEDAGMRVIHYQTFKGFERDIQKLLD